MHRRDTIVIGASAGGIGALRQVLASLPAGLQASVFVVQHQSPQAPGELVSLLGSVTPMPVEWVEEVMPVRDRRVYVAARDRHMVIPDVATVAPTRGPRENRARPAINPLFRTAAAARSSRTIGIVLSGLLDDGASGLHAIKRCGGVAVVQDPAEADYAQMPQSAIDACEVDHVVPLSGMGDLLERLTGQVAPEVEVPRDILVEARMSGVKPSDTSLLDAVGSLVPLGCPECGGPMWKSGEGAAAIYRCQVGHTLAPRALIESQSDEIERSLWVAVRALDQQVATLRSLAKDGRVSTMAEEYGRRADEAARHAAQARRFLVGSSPEAVDVVREQVDDATNAEPVGS